MLSNYSLGFHGLTNRETPDLSELATGRNRTSDAFCTSAKCMNDVAGKNIRSTGVRRYVSRSTTFCPECNSALHWRLREKQKE